MIRSVVFLLGVLLLSACSEGTNPSAAIPVQFPALEDLSVQRLTSTLKLTPTLSASLYKPVGLGPFPAIVVLHACGGIDGHFRGIGQRYAAQGYVSIVPDSFGPRGVSQACTGPGGGVTPGVRVADAYAAAAYLRTLAEVRGDRIGLVGYSHGAITVTNLAVRPPLAAPFRAGVAYYPFCGAAAGSIPILLPTLILAGGKDDWTPPAPCVAWGARVGDRAMLDVVLYPTAYHGFDRNFPDVDVMGADGRMHHMAYDRSVSADAATKVDAFLTRWLKE